MKNFQYLIALIISSILLVFLTVLLIARTRSRKKDQLGFSFIICLICMILWTVPLILQIIFQNTNINPVFFEGLASFGACFLPVFFMMSGIIFANTKISINWRYLFLFVMPILSTVLMFTNENHHLFYVIYSPSIRDTVYGPYMTAHSIYSYSLIAIGLFNLLSSSVKNSGFFSKQSLLFFVGVLIPLVINVVATLKIVNLPVYATPISFTISLLFFALAIFKFGFLNITPIALQRVVDRMSDGYIIVNDELFITDFNRTFLELFSLKASDIRNIYIGDLLSMLSGNKTRNKSFIDAVFSTKTNNSTINLERHFSQLNKYFNIEITSILNNNSYLGALILFKDVTQHKHDMQTIKSNQEILIERERLATLGQMIGGIAHNLKTPIMSISGAAEGILDLINEYRDSIGDPEVTIEDHKEIANDMEEWIRKIQSHLSYMSDIITTVKGQAVAFSDNSTFTSFTIDEFIKQVNILMKHELSHALVELEETIEIPSDTVVKGNINSLVQVVNNIISNAIQAYNGKVGEKIILDIYKENKNLVIKIQDFAGGIPDSVKSKLFKEMATTKGKNGTGLGLFMSYSNIKAHFNGNIRFDTRAGKGTSFFIEIPC